MSRRWILSAVLVCSSTAWAEPVRLGAIRLSDQPDRDVLELPGCDDSDNDPATRLMLRVNDYTAEITTLEVKFHNGDVQTLEVRNRFEPGTESRWIDLSGDAVGWGLNASSNLKIGDKNTVRLQAVYGEGIQNYMNDAPADVAIQSNPGAEVPVEGVAIPLVAGVAIGCTSSS